MKTLVVAATESELAQIKMTKPHHEKHTLAVGAFYLGQKLEELLIKNQGKINLVVLVGIAGCTHNHTLGSYMLVTNDCFGDLGAITDQSFETIEDMGFREKENLQISTFNKATDFSEAKAKAITVNTIYDNEQLNQLRLQKHHAEIENMEGAAFHHICEKYKVPYLHVRGLSNYIGERNKSQWKIGEAIKSYSTFLNKQLATWT